MGSWTFFDFRSVNNKFDATGSVQHAIGAGRAESVVIKDNKEWLQSELVGSPAKDKSQRRLSARLDISRTSLQRVRKELKLRPYCLRLVNALSEDARDRCVEFAKAWLYGVMVCGSVSLNGVIGLSLFDNTITGDIMEFLMDTFHPLLPQKYDLGQNMVEIE